MFLFILFIFLTVTGAFASVPWLIMSLEIASSSKTGFIGLVMALLYLIGMALVVTQVLERALAIFG